MEYLTRTIPCRPDDEGNVEATLLRAQPAAAAPVAAPPAENAASPAERPASPAEKAVLYLHGFVDYFFQDHVAAAFAERGYGFYALDLRKCGRSLHPWQHPNACRSIADYYEEIGAAIDLVQGDGVRDVTLMGHSTGGLIASLYAAEGAQRGIVRRIVLNSPFFEFNEAAPTRLLADVYAAALADRRPYAAMPKGLSPMVGESLHRQRRGEWDYNLAWKPIEGFPVFACWYRAIREGQRHVQKGLDLQVPVLLLHSDRSVKAGNRWNDDFMASDSVLDVEHMKCYGPGLGRHVTLVEIRGGLHDLFLSRAGVRAQALAATFGWLERNGSA